MRKMPGWIRTNPTKQKNLTLVTSKSIRIRVYFLKVYKFHPCSMFTKEKIKLETNPVVTSKSRRNIYRSGEAQ